MGYDLTQQGIQPQLRQLLEAQAKFNAEDIAIVVLRDNVTPEPTAEAWSYVVKFEMQTAAGEVIPYTGNIDATAAEDTSGGGTADPDDASPAMVMGQGTVTFEGTEHTWSDTDTATLTLSYTTAYGNAKTDTFVVTFTE